MHCYQQEGRQQLSERILQDGICESAYKWQIEQLLTDIEEQAQKMAIRVARIYRKTPTVNVYEIDDNMALI